MPVTVSRAVLTAFDDDTASVSLTCSAGFYVRSFAHELGRMLGCGACLEALRRTRSGDFTLPPRCRSRRWPARRTREHGRAGSPTALVPRRHCLPDLPAGVV